MRRTCDPLEEPHNNARMSKRLDSEPGVGAQLMVASKNPRYFAVIFHLLSGGGIIASVLLIGCVIFSGTTEPAVAQTHQVVLEVKEAAVALAALVVRAATATATAAAARMEIRRQLPASDLSAKEPMWVVAAAEARVVSETSWTAVVGEPQMTTREILETAKAVPGAADTLAAWAEAAAKAEQAWATAAWKHARAKDEEKDAMAENVETATAEAEKAEEAAALAAAALAQSAASVARVLASVLETDARVPAGAVRAAGAALETAALALRTAEKRKVAALARTALVTVRLAAATLMAAEDATDMRPPTST